MELTTTSIKRIDHIVLTTQNMKTCIAFYENLGFQGIDEGSRYCLLGYGLRINVHYKEHVISPHAYIAKPGTLDICFEVHDVQTWRTYLQSMHINCSEIAYKSGVKGKMKSFYFRDPDQNLLEFCAYDEIKQ